MIVVGEPLVEVSVDRPFAHGVGALLGVSGDVVNAGAAAAAAGATVAMIAVVNTDELGDAVLRRIADLGVSTDLIVRRPGQQGVYLQHSDPAGGREFSYARAGSVGSGLSVGDVDLAAVAAAGAVLASGITMALSRSSRSALLAAAAAAGRFVYDPNFRSRLTSVELAARALADIAPSSWLVTPSAPGEIGALLGEVDPQVAAERVLALGAGAVAVTCGSSGVRVVAEGASWWQPSVPAPSVVDQTGAGDVFAGTLTARIALGDKLSEAVLLAAAAASLAVGGVGGTGLIPGLDRTRAHARVNAEGLR